MATPNTQTTQRGSLAEKQVYDALLANEEVRRIYGPSKIFQGYVAPNTLASSEEYVYISRVSDVTLDKGLDTIGDTLRRVRIQVDVCDVEYSRMADRSALIRDVLRNAFPSSLDGSTRGTVASGQTVWNVTSLDIIIYEKD